MPFSMDCRDRGEPAALDATAQVVKLTGIAELLGAAELGVLLLIAERLLEGRRRYGELNLDTDPRDFRREALAEMLDFSCYVSMALLKPCTCTGRRGAAGGADD